MKSGWQKYLLYASIVLFWGFLLFETLRLKNTGFEGKSLWDWMELLIIPLVLAVGAFYLNRSERNTERIIAADRQQEIALQAYIDRMAELMLKENLRKSEKLEARRIATVRTLTVLRRLDLSRKVIVLRFLYEADLITNDGGYYLDLEKADLRGVDLRGADLGNSYLPYVDLSNADLRNANLSGANLLSSKLIEANLNGALLRGTKFFGADLTNADLRNAELNLRGFVARFLKEDETISDLEYADLMDANLSGANLLGAIVTDEQLAQAKSLKGATMSDGTKHE